MYVRSQNKRYLSYVINFQIGGIDHDQIWNSDDKELLGIYKNEERALEVMDMIQDRLEDGITILIVTYVVLHYNIIGITLSCEETINL